MFVSAKEAVRTLRKVMEISGYTIHRTRGLGEVHQSVYPQATYAPWSVDKEFIAAYQQVRFHTLVDIYRLWELWKFVEQSARLPAGDFIEIGVWRGGSGCLIAQKAKLLGIDSQVFLCDTFTGIAKAGPMDDHFKGGELADTAESVVEALARKLDVKVKPLKGVFPEETGAAVGDRIFRFCHIDVDVYQSARDCTEWIWPRLTARGIIVYDDYGFKGADGVRRFVEEWVSGADCTFVHNLNGHAILIKP